MKIILTFCFCFISIFAFAATIRVGEKHAFKQLKPAIAASKSGDTVLVDGGFYKEGNLLIDKKICLIGINLPVLDGDHKFEVLSVKADSVLVSGFRVQHSSYAVLDDPGGIKIYDSRNVIIQNNFLHDNFFGIYVQNSKNCLVKNNVIVAFKKNENQIGNGIHCWKSDSLLIIGNTVKGHRDGIYLEFVTKSVIWRNIAYNNIRYGLHFMFSHEDAYFCNVFRNNGAGVAVMFTRKVTMMNNTFEQNWGDAAYGLLLKEISDCYLAGNRFIYNTTGIFMEGANRFLAEKNDFAHNGWGMKIMASCMDNVLKDNNFIANTFDVSTNGTTVLNKFSGNYWDKYVGYDLNRDGTGDVPFRPLSMFSVITESNGAAMLLYRSFIITLLDKSEKIFPTLTPENFSDDSPRMKALKN